MPSIPLWSLCTHGTYATHLFKEMGPGWQNLGPCEGALAGDNGTLRLLSLLLSHHEMSRWVNHKTHDFVPLHIPHSGANPQVLKPF